MTRKRFEFDRRDFLRAATATGLGVSGLGAVAGPGAARGRCDVFVAKSDPRADASTVQGGVDTAEPGDTVCIDEGTYHEQVTINKDLTLTSARGAEPTIAAPSDMDAFTISESDPTWEPIVFAHGGTESNGDVSGPETVRVSVSGLTIDGQATQPTARRKVGVLYRNVGGHRGGARIEANTVERMGVGGKETMGILAYGDSSVHVLGNEVTDFERGGIGANGDGGQHPSPRLSVRNNTLDANAGTNDAWAPNGIQIGFGAAGDVKGNVVRNCRWATGPDATWTASGALVFESDGVVVQGNTFVNNDVGAAASAWAWFLDSADETRIQHNEIRDSLLGVHLRANAWDGFATANPSVSNCKVVRNEISDPSDGPDGAIGVQIEGVDSDPENDPVLENNKIVRNRISGFDRGVVDAGTATKVRANVIPP